MYSIKYTQRQYADLQYVYVYTLKNTLIISRFDVYVKYIIHILA